MTGALLSAGAAGPRLSYRRTQEAEQLLAAAH
jgi:hypothetical protein